MSGRIHSKSRSASSVPINSWSTKLMRESKPETIRTKGSNTRKSLNASSFNNSRKMDFSQVESEYIHNLQQQIYYLELECEYLNEERKKLITVPTSVSIEAENMIRRVKAMQGELHVREKEILEKDSTINMLQRHKESTLSQLEIASDEFATEKKELVNQIVLLKKDIESMELDATKSNAEFENMNQTLSKALDDSKLAEAEKNSIQNKLHETMEQLSNLRVQHEEKRTECVKLQTDLQELDDRFFQSQVRDKENADNQLRDEIKTLRYQLREKELQSERDRALRLKIADDCGALVKENAALSSQAIEYQKQLEMEKEFNRNNLHRKEVNIQELVTLKEERKINEREIERYKELYELEQEKYRSLLDKFSVEEESHSRVKLQNNKLQASLDEVAGLKSIGSEENVRLRRDNLLLSDQVNDLQVKLQKKEYEIDDLQNNLLELRHESKTLKSKYRLMSSFDQIKWDEFEQMADQMKSLSRNLTPVLSSSVRRSKEVELDT